MSMLCKSDEIYEDDGLYSNMTRCVCVCVSECVLSVILA